MYLSSYYKYLFGKVLIKEVVKHTKIVQLKHQRNKSVYLMAI